MAAGLGEAFLVRYQNNLLDSTIGLLESNKLATAIEAMIHEKREWTGSVSQLATELVAHGYDVSQTPEKLSHAVRRLAPALRLGLNIDIEHLDRQGLIRPLKISLIGAVPQGPTEPVCRAAVARQSG
jgi:hypothetical protein